MHGLLLWHINMVSVVGGAHGSAAGRGYCSGFAGQCQRRLVGWLIESRCLAEEAKKEKQWKQRVLNCSLSLVYVGCAGCLCNPECYSIILTFSVNSWMFWVFFLPKYPSGKKSSGATGRKLYHCNGWDKMLLVQKFTKCSTIKKCFKVSVVGFSKIQSTSVLRKSATLDINWVEGIITHFSWPNFSC